MKFSILVLTLLCWATVPSISFAEDGHNHAEEGHKEAKKGDDHSDHAHGKKKKKKQKEKDHDHDHDKGDDHKHGKGDGYKHDKSSSNEKGEAHGESHGHAHSEDEAHKDDHAHSDDDEHSEGNEKHVHSEEGAHDDHGEEDSHAHAENDGHGKHEGEGDHDDHGGGSGIGPGKAITEVKDDGNKFKLSPESAKYLGIIAEPIRFSGKGLIAVSKKSLVRFQNTKGIYVKVGDWYEIKKVQIIEDNEKEVIIRAGNLNSNSMIATSGLGFLRAAHLHASGQGGKGHAH